MAPERKDNIGDTTASVGTGTLNLAAVAQVGALIFAGNVTSGATVRYDIRSADNTEWEIGEGVFTDGAPDTLTRVTIYASSAGGGAKTNFSAGTKNVSMVSTAKDFIGEIAPPNLLKNGNFINNSTNGYGTTPDDWVSSNANPISAGIPDVTKQNLIDGLGIADGDIELFCPLNGNLNDLSSNGYNLTGSGGITDHSDGLMAQCKDFDGTNGQAQHTSANNVTVSGSKTIFFWIKRETQNITNPHFFEIKNTGGTIGFRFKNLSGVTQGRFGIDVVGVTFTTGQGGADPDFGEQTEVGKWYFCVAVIDDTNKWVDWYINGAKSRNVYTGTITAGSGNTIVALGSSGGAAYLDCKMQTAGILSVALTNNQVKKLVAMLGYQRTKIRRATTNAILYQDLPMNLVEYLRGKTVALRSDMWQAVASTSQISILVTLADASTSETIISATDATTGSWLEKLATGTIGATAVGIRIQLKHSTSDGNTWFRRVSLYEGSVLLPYDHSKDDWSRFPRLLRMDIPLVFNGYRFEEFRWYTAPLILVQTLLGFSAITAQLLRFMIDGKKGFIIWNLTGTSNAANLDFQLPFMAKGNAYLSSNSVASCIDNSVAQDTGIVAVGIGGLDSALLKIGKTNSTRAANAFGGFTTSGIKGSEGQLVVEID